MLTADLAASEESPAEALRSLIARCGGRCADRLGVPEAGSDLKALEGFLYRAAPPLPVGRLLRARPLVAVATEAPVEATPPWARLRARRSARGGAIAVRRGSIAPSEPGRHRRAHLLDGWQVRVADAARKRRGPLAAAVVIVIGAAVATAVGASPAPGPSAPPRTAATARPTPAPTPPDAEATPESAATELLSRPPPARDRPRPAWPL